MRRLATVSLPAGSRWWRGTRHDPAEPAPSTAPGSRFAPVAGAGHVYVGSTRTVSLLESALHEASGPAPTIYRGPLAAWSIVEIELLVDVQVADLRAPQLAELGIAPAELTAASPRHYPCTRRWAEVCWVALRRGDVTGGIVWHSRQADLHASAQPDGLLADVLVHAAVEVGVLWVPPSLEVPFRPTGLSQPLLLHGEPSQLLRELSALIGAPIL